MFTAAVDWVGLAVAGAALALRMYLREKTVMTDEQLTKWAQEKQKAQSRMRDLVWADRDMMLEQLLLHDCELKQFSTDLLYVLMLNPEQWILGALAGDRDVAES